MSANLREFARENGYFLLVQRILGGLCRRSRDAILARRLHAPGFRIGRSPRLLGVAHIHVGHSFRAGDNLWLEAITLYAGQRFNPRLTIGANVSFSDAVHIGCLSSITIADGTLIGSRVLISDHSHGIYRSLTQDTLCPSDPATIPAQRPLHSTAPIHIGRNVWIGDGAAILAGATIGNGAVIGANSVVTGPIPAATIAVGAPARPIRRWNPATSQWQPLMNSE
jgi:acetyltransferase-like isoleucine patch superfamily enzyme